MLRTDRKKSDSAALLALARRIDRPDVRRLFARFCHEVAHFSEDVVIESAPFDVTLRGPCGFAVAVSPLRELFLVSLGESRLFDIRVASVDDFTSALDLTLNKYLAAQARTPSAS